MTNSHQNILASWHSHAQNRRKVIKDFSILIELINMPVLIATMTRHFLPISLDRITNKIYVNITTACLLFLQLIMSHFMPCHNYGFIALCSNDDALFFFSSLRSQARHHKCQTNIL
jgi:hypothetical protein